MDSSRITDNPIPHALEDDVYNRAWKMSESLLQLRVTEAGKVIRDLHREFNENIEFLQKAFVGKEDRLPTLDASIQAMFTSLFSEVETLSQGARLIVPRATPTLSPGQVEASQAFGTSKLSKRSRDDDDQPTCSKGQKSIIREHPVQISVDIANLTKRQCQARHLHKPQMRALQIYTMPDVIPKISRADVEFSQWVFKYPAIGNGYFVVQCHWGPCTQSKLFIRHPFEKGQAMTHFNNPHQSHGKEGFTESEIMKTFALQVQDANDEWVTASNMVLYRPSPSINESDTITTKKSRCKVANRSTTRVVMRKPLVNSTNTEPPSYTDFDSNYHASSSISGLPIIVEADHADDQRGSPTEASLPEIRVHTDAIS